MNIRVVQDNTKEVINETEKKILLALEQIGALGERYTIDNIVQKNVIDTGNYLGSITHIVDERNMQATWGSNVEYAVYLEMGTSKMDARPCVSPSLIDHIPEYRAIIEDALKTI